MEIRVGVKHAIRDIEVELPTSIDREKIQKSINDALQGKNPVFEVTDRSGKDVFIPSSSITYVELSGDDSERRIGFGID